MIILLDHKIFGPNLSYLRKSRGLSRHQLGQALGIPALIIKLLEEGNIREVDPSRLHVICDYFGVTEADLLSRPLWVSSASSPESK